jgi:hypothetical protein
MLFLQASFPNAVFLSFFFQSCFFKLPFLMHCERLFSNICSKLQKVNDVWILFILSYKFVIFENNAYSILIEFLIMILIGFLIRQLWFWRLKIKVLNLILGQDQDEQRILDYNQESMLRVFNAYIRFIH